MYVITCLWQYEQNDWILNMKQIDGDEYTSEP